MFSITKLQSFIFLGVFLLFISLFFVFQSQTQSNSFNFIPTVAAFGGGGGGGGGGGSGGGGGCGGCGGGSTGGGPGGGGPSYTTPVIPPPPPAPVCEFIRFNGQTGTVNVAAGTTSGTLAWSTSNATTVTLNGASVALNNANRQVTFADDTTWNLVVRNAAGQQDTCAVSVVVADPDPLPVCVINANPSSIIRGNSSNLVWTTTNAVSASIDQGIDSVAIGTNRTESVSPTNTTTYTMTVTNAEGDTADCDTTLTVSDPPADPLPVCVISANPNSIEKGKTSILTWTTTNAVSASIDQGIDTVAIGTNRAQSVSPDNTTTYTMTVVDDNGDQATCATKITVTSTPTQDPFTCDDITFNANRSSLPRGGGDVTFNWNASIADTVSIPRLNTNNKTGTETVRITSTETVTLNATKDGTSISCPVRVTVDTSGGGGGGGSSSPRCELDISKRTISSGEAITLTWDSSRASDVIITDNHGKTIITTEDRLSRDKEELFDGSITLRPTRDTTYTMIVERGSRDDECTVSVDIDGDGGVVVKETRSQQPIVAGIALTQVPYTGFEAGPMLTMLFYTLLVLWGLFVAYVFVIRRSHLGGVSLSGSHGYTPVADVTTDAVTNAGNTQESEAEAYVAVATTTASTATAPQNLPIAAGYEPVIGYANSTKEVAEPEAVAEPVPVIMDDATNVTELENRAHMQKALFSSDAMRLIVAETEVKERDATLDRVITKAKETYPSENGWVVINHERCASLLGGTEATVAISTEEVAATATTKAAATAIPSEPTTAGSLAEAIATANVSAAYQMIAHRPMVALADAASEFDTVIRNRNGAKHDLSDLLMVATKDLSETDIRDAVHALTSALDGVYTDEEEAVKMAIMKAVKAVN